MWAAEQHCGQGYTPDAEFSQLLLEEWCCTVPEEVKRTYITKIREQNIKRRSSHCKRASNESSENNEEDAFERVLDSPPDFDEGEYDPVELIVTGQW